MDTGRPGALITGAGGRLGGLLANHLSEAGYALSLHAHQSVEVAEGLARSLRAAGGEAEVQVADLRCPDAVEQLAAEVLQSLPRLDLVLHCAATFDRHPLSQTDALRWSNNLDLHIRGPALLSQALSPALAAARGQLLFVTDLSGVQGWAAYGAHSVSRAGGLMLAQILAQALAPSVRVNTVALGAILGPKQGDRAAPIDAIPLGRRGDGEDLIHAVDYLLSAPYVTGEVLHVDGGRHVAIR